MARRTLKLAVVVSAFTSAAASDGRRLQAVPSLSSASKDNYEPQCQSDDDHGWPRFQSQDELRKSPWASYFMDTYGELPASYPVCIYDFWAINKHAYDKANITGHQLVAPSNVKDGDLFELGFTGYQIYHSTWKPLPSNTWFELSHMAVPTELSGLWAVRQRGSGIWYNSGKTIVFPTPADNTSIHKEAIEFLKANCSITPSFRWPQLESDIFGTCAREKGYDTIQFEPAAGEAPLGTFGITGLTEMVLVNMAGRYSCGVEDSTKTPLRAGWRASQQCRCKNVEMADSCGLTPTPPFPYNIIGTKPPICELQKGPIWAPWRKKPCNPKTCGVTSCGSKPAPTEFHV